MSQRPPQHDDGPAVSIAIAVVEQGGRFLARPRPSPPLKGLWEFPGGKVEQGETVAEAARRECREETRIDVEVLGELLCERETYDHGSVQLSFLRARPLETDPTGEASWRWIPRGELAALEFPRGNRRVIDLLLRQGGADD